jgi:hypothetical protein
VPNEYSPRRSCFLIDTKTRVCIKHGRWCVRCSGISSNPNQSQHNVAVVYHTWTALPSTHRWLDVSCQCSNPTIANQHDMLVHCTRYLAAVLPHNRSTCARAYRRRGLAGVGTWWNPERLGFVHDTAGTDIGCRIAARRATDHLASVNRFASNKGLGRRVGIVIERVDKRVVQSCCLILQTLLYRQYLDSKRGHSNATHLSLYLSIDRSIDTFLRSSTSSLCFWKGVFFFNFSDPKVSRLAVIIFDMQSTDTTGVIE